MVAVSPSTGAALHHLKKIRPLDGWSVESSGRNGIRLLRRNVPLTDNYFLDLHHDEKGSGAVLGILSAGTGGTAQAQLLVDKDGLPRGNKMQVVSIRTYNPNKSGNSSNTGTATNRTSRLTTSGSGYSNNATNNNNPNTLSDEQNKQLLKYAGGFVVASMFFSVLSRALFAVYIIALPLLYLYSVQTCPASETFDAKQQLKRVLRGQHLPENHPKKPKGWLEQTIAKVGASVSTELATSLGYEVSLQTFGGACTLATVRVPTSAMDFYWIGAFGGWHFVYSNKYDQE